MRRQILNYKLRIAHLQERMSKQGIDIILLNYSRSLLYYTGTVQPSYFLVSPHEYHLLVIRGSEHVARETSFSEEKISYSVKGHDGIFDLLKKWKISNGTLGMELDVVPANLYLKLSATFSQFSIKDVSQIILDQRKIKDENELHFIRQACLVMDAGHKRILEVLQDGMTELELASEIEDAHRKAGHEGQFFSRQFDFFAGRGPIASGENLSQIAGKVQSITGVGLSSAIPLGASQRKIRRGDVIVVDMPTFYRGYHSDQSRTYSLGKAPAACRTLHGGMKEIADQIIAYLRPGMTCQEVYNKAIQTAHELGYADHFMFLGPNGQRVPFIGHGIGLEVNEPPLVSNRNQEVIRAGMVITLELEMWKSISEVVKLEDTILIRADGIEIMTVTPRELHEV